jgi:hypothetical protein
MPSLKQSLSKTPRQAVVLLGASNLTIGWNAVAASLHSTLRQPLDLYVALGMGRSYVEHSRFMARGLPGIQNCGIWDQSSAAADSGPPAVLITDVGNDVVYGHDATTIIQAVESCINQCRLLHQDSDIVMTALPLQSIESLGQFRFTLFKKLLFPGLRLTLSEVKQRSFQLNEAVCQLATEQDIPLITPRTEWYGLDPIHIRRRHRRVAFDFIFSHLSVVPATECASVTPSLHWTPPCANERIVFGREKICPQPCRQSSSQTVYAF